MVVLILQSAMPCIAARPAHYDESMNLGMPEMIFIFLLALVVVGPKRLPELGRQLGKVLAEFKRASNEFKNQLETEMMNIELEERAKKPESLRTPRPTAGRTILARREAVRADQLVRQPARSAVAFPKTGSAPEPLRAADAHSVCA